MLVLILGGSGSGKSAYAEEYVMSHFCDFRKYYIATMQICDEEGRKKVRRHKKMREGKGFFTIEQPVDVSAIAEKIQPDTKNDVGLLECVSNLLANEMFGGNEREDTIVVSERVLAGIDRLHQLLGHLVIVSNNVFEDGLNYDAATVSYIQALGLINQGLAERADEVIEVVAGIPIRLKEE